MKKIATITFHSSYNYGSNLQAYALQEFIKKLHNDECEYRIINLRTDKQKDMCALYHKNNSIRNIVRNIIYFHSRKNIKIKNEKFENFITNKLNITKEYNSLEELKNEKFNYDYYISGSDQLWNVNAWDFDWANYLEFVNEGIKISYSASFGPITLNLTEEQKDRISKLLKEYKYISVREKGSYETVYNLTSMEPEINVDPTMLLGKEEWDKITSNERIIEGDYILFYSLHPDKKMVKLVKNISKALKLPVVVTKINNQYDTFAGFKKVYNTGPMEFLSLIKNAKLVLSSSFHGTIFSVLFNKPFYAIRGNKDNRISTLLEKMKLQDRSISEQDDINEKMKNAFNINFDDVNDVINKEKLASENYLKKALDIGE